MHLKDKLTALCIAKNCFTDSNISSIYIFSADSDQVDSKPSSDLLDLYFYKMDQLREILERVYNADDMKRLSIKLSTSQRAHLFVIWIYINVAENFNVNV